MIITTKKIATDKSLAASWNNVQEQVNGNPFKIEMSWTGTVAGTLHLEETGSEQIWSTIPDSTITVTNDGAQTIQYIENNCFTNVRVVWTRTSGNGTFNAYLCILDK